MFGIGMTELMVILVIGLLVLGPKRLPEMARSLGKGLNEFRRASGDLRREFTAVADEARIDPADPKLDEATTSKAGEPADEKDAPAQTAAETEPKTPSDG
jgi:Tat protein translocase TatB subunit